MSGDIWRIVGLALILSIAFGVLPAWSGSRVAPQLALRSGTATNEIRISEPQSAHLPDSGPLVLLADTGFLIRTFYVLRHTDPGFDVEHLIVFAINPGVEGRPAKLPTTFTLELQRRIGSLPGVCGTNLVVGVAGDSKYRSLREAFLPIFYVPIEHGTDWGPQFYLYVRTQAPGRHH